ncbi:hypothetical protein AURDEDRAFT_160175 [Auricularia subglabra TFB-10046 SS5]|nr:hypothetical protein AURDEDRAFT_160175 [Auricularia subglabra TFB-10046 SS5]
MTSAKAAAEAAESAHDDLIEELTLAQSHRAELMENLANLPTVYDAELLETLPTEILQAIFVDVINCYPIALPFSKAEYNRGRAEAPFRLAAVCRRWRAVALHMSELWTYIAMPPGNNSIGSRLNLPLFQCLIDRSQPRPLDIVFPFADAIEAMLSWHHVMTPVIAAFPRWGRARIDLPARRPAHEYAFLQRDAPVLEELYIDWASYMGDWSVAPITLSASRSLRALHAPASLIAPQSFLPGVSWLGIVLDGAAGPSGNCVTAM